MSKVRLDFNPNLGGGIFTPPPCWFSLNNSETAKAATVKAVTSCQVWYPSLAPISDVGQNSNVGVSDFWNSGQSLTNKNCHNSRTNSDIDMKLGPVTILEKKNMVTSKIFDNDVMSANYDVIVIFPICG